MIELEELRIPTRGLNALTRANIRTVYQLSGMEQKEIAAIPGVGMVTARLIQQELERFGLWDLREQDEGQMAELGRPEWLMRSLQLGITPQKIQEYLDIKWPLPTIAAELRIDVDTLNLLMDRWDLQEHSKDAS